MNGRVAVLGAPAEIRGWGLAGLLVIPAADDTEARKAWATLPAGVRLVVLTHAAAEAIGAAGENDGPLIAVLP
ncbi:hypothetical protein C8E87_0319 [Paractinoplanes brasiliensis]|uniref:ATP synthase F subunit n=1 Tax=Paractinoplanes brasiliensis TaxID=52695 RepID=A0A4R6JLP6_9ACTN|nr:hypothetical protein C8E87_0319 [Actinoplanes brasiliensis]GID32375.1 hypothetical protein Abr02nite_73580 [Actinoplanes brasiliensis]